MRFQPWLVAEQWEWRRRNFPVFRDEFEAKFLSSLSTIEREAAQLCLVVAVVVVVTVLVVGARGEQFGQAW